MTSTSARTFTLGRATTSTRVRATRCFTMKTMKTDHLPSQARDEHEGKLTPKTTVYAFRRQALPRQAGAAEGLFVAAERRREPLSLLCWRYPVRRQRQHRKQSSRCRPEHTTATSSNAAPTTTCLPALPALPACLPACLPARLPACLPACCVSVLSVRCPTWRLVSSRFDSLPGLMHTQARERR